MNPVLKLLLEGEPLSTEQMGEVLGMSETQVAVELENLKEEGILMGWRPIINPDFGGDEIVHAVIEVKISPEREGGFDRLAERISKFDRVESCYLMSGAYDLLLIIHAENLKRIASFVFEKLATLDGVVSTATHFMLKAYKEQGYFIARPAAAEDKPSVSP
ncbi:Lrp/AsnC family transcriptional regulator [Ruficoccus amylovorans]|uniref:Lrp/AsnC family transcriptional regulator n=1 Tax=Ruficoccus amylovorans TaxID=1804625 RepID=A0A842HAW4_9BACT|nr:Lrp/AsnC family transcriptional regulator [Ruficoccus amylovorans]MBC2593562.1 Lrp/AsnC family transcriptional regulator [Ruficoccus amylovorans]